MTPFDKLKTTLMVAGLLAVPVAQAASMTKAEYRDGKARISASYKADKTACDTLKANAKDVCREEAEAKDKVALAELEYAYTGKSSDRTQVQVVKAETAYKVAKERCDDQAGNAKDVCEKEAKAVEVKALADARMSQEISASRKDAASDKADADYNVALEKCDALAGDAKGACVAAARTKYGKN